MECKYNDFLFFLGLFFYILTWWVWGRDGRDEVIVINGNGLVVVRENA